MKDGTQPQPSDDKVCYKGPPRADDLTSIHPEQAHWNINSLPEILYVLRGDETCHAAGPKPPKTYESFGKFVRDFPVLPSQISSQVEGWRIEAWCRLDPRITAQDIVDRVNPVYDLTGKKVASRRYRFRVQNNISCWSSESSMEEITHKLVEKGVDPALNTTRGLSAGWIDPTRRERGYIPVVRRTPAWDSTTPCNQGRDSIYDTPRIAPTGPSPGRSVPSGRHLHASGSGNGDNYAGFVSGSTNSCTTMELSLREHFQHNSATNDNTASFEEEMSYLNYYYAACRDAVLGAGLREYPEVINIASFDGCSL